MAATTGGCPVSAKGIGVECAKGNILKMPYLAIAAVPGFQFDTYDDFKDETKWVEGIADGNLFPLSKFEFMEDASLEETTVESDAGTTYTTRDSQRGFLGGMDLSLKQNELFQEYGETGWTLFMVDEAGNLEGQTPDGTVVKGYDLSDFDPKPMTRSLGADTKSHTKVSIRFAYNEQMDKQIVVAQPSSLDWQPKELANSALTWVTTSNVSISTSTITVSWNWVDDRDADLTTVPIRTVTDALVILVDQTGATLTPTTDYTVVETSTPGTYTVDATVGGMTSGTIQLSADNTVNLGDDNYYGDTTTVTP